MKIKGCLAVVLRELYGPCASTSFLVSDREKNRMGVVRELERHGLVEVCKVQERNTLWAVKRTLGRGVVVELGKGQS